MEGEAAFRRRLSRAEWENPDERPDNVSETRRWTVGDQGAVGLASLGLVDWDCGELASCNLICVHPVTGWWRERPHLGRWIESARYSLFVSIETRDSEVDLYTPIVNQDALQLNGEKTSTDLISTELPVPPF